jgi:hypothetical protein
MIGNPEKADEPSEDCSPSPEFVFTPCEFFLLVWNGDLQFVHLRLLRSDQRCENRGLPALIREDKLGLSDLCAGPLAVCELSLDVLGGRVVRRSGLGQCGGLVGQLLLDISNLRVGRGPVFVHAFNLLIKLVLQTAILVSNCVFRLWNARGFCMTRVSTRGAATEK